MRTTDIWFASFLQLQGYRVSNFTTIGKGKGAFEFSLSEDEWHTMRLLFNDSDISKIKQIQLSLKDLLY